TGSLSRLVTSLNTAIGAVVPETEVVLFATGAVEMWRRALYTLILAAMLQDVNVSWGCVAGYYASHYCVRAFAQLFGYFAVYRHRVFVEVSPLTRIISMKILDHTPQSSARSCVQGLSTWPLPLSRAKILCRSPIAMSILT